MENTLEISEKTYGFTIYWRIENFSCKPSKKFSIRSPYFEIKSLNSKWHVEIKQKYGFLAVYLVKDTYSFVTFSTFSAVILRSSGWLSILENVPVRFGIGQVHAGVDDLISFEELKDQKWIYLPNGSLTIGFCLGIKDFMKESSQTLIISRLLDENELHHRQMQTFSNLKPNDLLHFPIAYEFQEAKQFAAQSAQTVPIVGFRDSEELLEFFKQKEFRFVTLRTFDKEFVVHKAVLCARSPVFNSMFEMNMTEKEWNLVRIDDIDSETVTLLIKFLHFESLESLSFIDASKLYYAADKYQIESLKSECAKSLKRELSAKNVYDVLVLANRHQNENLMRYTIKYFCQNSKEILQSDEWQTFFQRHLELATRIYSEIKFE